MNPISTSATSSSSSTPISSSSTSPRSVTSAAPVSVSSTAPHSVTAPKSVTSSSMVAVPIPRHTYLINPFDLALTSGSIVLAIVLYSLRKRSVVRFTLNRNTKG